MAVDVFDGYWLPTALRERVLTGATWETLWLKGGALTTQDTPDAVAVRWPRLTPAQWNVLLDGLQQARTVGGREVLARWQAVLDVALARLAEQSPAMLPTLSTCTGYSPQMLAMALGQGDLIKPSSLAAALEYQPTWSAATRWEQMPGLPGQVRFFPQRALDRATSRLVSGSPLCRPAPPIDLALGFAAGNVPGTALVIALLGGLANCAAGDKALSPAVIVRNSRHEPLFAPWVLSVVEAIDPALVAGLAVLIWDQDAAIQGELMRRAGLMIAAAGDDTIAALDATRARAAPTLRFHRHGHKASFAVVQNQPSETGRPESTIPRLAALDSALWDQNGCLSPRAHFVEGDAEGYAQALVHELRALSASLPRGTTPRRFIHRAFDAYTALARLRRAQTSASSDFGELSRVVESSSRSSQVRVYSTYDDDFAVIVDARAWNAETLRRAVNACAGRVIIVCPVKDALDAPGFLRWIPAANLQSVSVALAQDRVLEFAQAAGACGVTAVRSLGRAAFPQLAYSWDGWLPLDMGHLRPEGHFTTVEFDDLRQEIEATSERWKL